ncbi:MAG: hypothetical protein HRU19_30040 [Pseudobacteriovorax sp.]|nr:hypothetical protein [Pseudobacteriovorax sp.]
MKPLLILICLVFTIPTGHAKSIAIIGDSISSGGGAHPNLALDQEALAKVFEGQVVITPDAGYLKKLEELGFTFASANQPVRLPLSKREYKTPLSWWFESLWLSFSSRFLDAEEYSWGYLLAREMGITENQIYIAAQDGAAMMSLENQIDRVLDIDQGRLPEIVMIFYTGNDMCGLTPDMLTTPEEYGETLAAGLQYLRLNGEAASSGTKVYVVDPISMLQIVSRPSIQEKVVRYRGRDMTCRDLQTSNFGPEPQVTPATDEVSAILNFFIKPTQQFCPSLFAMHKEPKIWGPVLSNRITGYREQIAQVVDNANKLAGGNIVIRHIQSTRSVIFEGDDMANDCFHIGLQGQAKIAKSVMDGMKL